MVILTGWCVFLVGSLNAPPQDESQEIADLYIARTTAITQFEAEIERTRHESALRWTEDEEKNQIPVRGEMKALDDSIGSRSSVKVALNRRVTEYVSSSGVIERRDFYDGSKYYWWNDRDPQVTISSSPPPTLMLSLDAVLFRAHGNSIAEILSRSTLPIESGRFEWMQESLHYLGCKMGKKKWLYLGFDRTGSCALRHKVIHSEDEKARYRNEVIIKGTSDDSLIGLAPTQVVFRAMGVLPTATSPDQEEPELALLWSYEYDVLSCYVSRDPPGEELQPEIPRTYLCVNLSTKKRSPPPGVHIQDYLDSMCDIEVRRPTGAPGRVTLIGCYTAATLAGLCLSAGVRLLRPRER